jgi:hypothetical protein
MLSVSVNIKIYIDIILSVGLNVVKLKPIALQEKDRWRVFENVY